jgi:inorganic pyrophosphatase
MITVGMQVTVTVDRPIGSHHPDYPDMIYPINYGYVEGEIAGDGEWQDAYVLGTDKPIKSISGTVIARIHRENDVEDKLVVAPQGASYTEDEIIRLTEFQEKYFDITVVM